MIEIKDLTVTYDEGVVLDKVSLSLDAGNIIGIIGPNGAGKSTFLKAMLGLIPYQGQVVCDDHPLVGQAAYVEQKSQIDPHFPMTVRDCVSLGLYQKVGLFHRLKRQDWQLVDNVLEQVGLLDLRDRPIKALSGGQFQRMLVARCLVQGADVIFLDEPFVGIDLVSEGIIIAILKQLKSEGKLIVIVHHDLSKVTTYFDQIIILNKKVIAYGDVETYFRPSYLKEAYGDSIFIGKEM